MKMYKFLIFVLVSSSWTVEGWQEMRRYCGVIMALIALGHTLAVSQTVSYAPTKHYSERVALFDSLTDLDSTKIVMLGNSLTENAGDWNLLLGTTNVVNRGISGDDAQGIINRLVQILPYKPKAIFLMCGTNDLSHELTPQQVFDNCKKVIDSILAGSPETRLYVQSLLPINESFRRWKRLVGKTNDIPVINEKLKAYCEERNITYIPLFPHFTRGNSNVLLRTLSVDGLHLSRPGYSIWASELRGYIKEINGDTN